MTKHEPECWIVSQSNPLNGCICTELRSCIQRVKRIGYPLWHLKGATWGREQGWNEALDAAREAVSAVDVRKDTSYEMRMQALAVIEALREKP